MDPAPESLLLCGRTFKPYALVIVGEELNFLDLVRLEMWILFGYLAD